MAPFVKKHHFNLRSTDDLFVMVIECTGKANESDIVAFLGSIGGKDVKVEEAETGWWLGRYDRDKKPFEHKQGSLA
jgi:hypothetical protein